MRKDIFKIRKIESEIKKIEKNYLECVKGKEM